jgi:hypothetical protein
MGADAGEISVVSDSVQDWVQPGDAPFQNVNQLAAAGVDPQVVAQISRYCDVRSHTFTVTVTAQIGNYKRDFNAILYRNGPTVQVVSFYWNY